MEFITHTLVHAFQDTIKLVPFLFLTYLAMEAIEHKAGNKAEEVVQRAGFAGPLVGAVLGAFPQCGFSAAASTFYAGRVITLGTLFAVFLSTSDEMLPILIAEQADPVLIAQILGIKVLVGMVMGFVIDAVVRMQRRSSDRLHIHDMCEREHCACHQGGGILKSAIKHTLQVTLFIFLITLVLDGIIEGVGEETFSNFIAASPVLSVFAACTVGLIPNCAASVVITELFLDGALSTGAMLGGLLTGAGVGLLVLFRSNRNLKQNIIILLVLWAIGCAWGLIFNAVGLTLG